MVVLILTENSLNISLCIAYQLWEPSVPWITVPGPVRI